MEINLFEAEQLARLTAGQLGVAPSQAKRTRSELLSSRLRTKTSGERPRQRVNEMPRASLAEVGEPDGLDTEPEDLEDFDPYDWTHLFWE